MPRHGACAGLEELLAGLVACRAVHDVQFWEAFRRAGRGMDVVAAEIASELEGLLDGEIGEVLISEGDDFALGNETRQFVLAGVRQGAELDASDFGADCWGQFRDFGALWEEVLEAYVGILPMIVVFEWLKSRVLLRWVPCWKVMLILQERVSEIFLACKKTHDAIRGECGVLFERKTYFGRVVSVLAVDLGVLVKHNGSKILVCTNRGNKLLWLDRALWERSGLCSGRCHCVLQLS
jgi:hypothetical protein